MNEQPKPVERVIALDVHPDSFTAAILRGPTPAAAIVEKVFNKLPMSRLEQWVQKNTTEQDLLVLEASGNSFQVVRTLSGGQRKAKVLESCQMGKLKEAHANNDKISAVRIGKAYLAGTAKEVWVPDAKTQDRRDLLHAHRKATKRNTQMRARLHSYLSDNGVRLHKDLPLIQPGPAEAQIGKARSWSPRQWQVIEGLLLELRHAEQQRRHWRSLIAQEVLADPQLLQLVRLCGIRDIIAFALGAFIGDIHRFAHPKNLVKYVGLNPAFDESGQEKWTGGIGGHGNKHLRCLLIEGAQSILRSKNNTLARWGKRLLARKGSVNLAVAAIARKMIVAVWYLMMGRWTALQEMELALRLKVGKIIGQVGAEALQKLDTTPKNLREQAYQSLQATNIPAPPCQDQALAQPQTQADKRPQDPIEPPQPPKDFKPKAKPMSLAQEYGLR